MQALTSGLTQRTSPSESSKGSSSLCLAGSICSSWGPGLVSISPPLSKIRLHPLCVYPVMAPSSGVLLPILLRATAQSYFVLVPTLLPGGFLPPSLGPLAWPSSPFSPLCLLIILGPDSEALLPLFLANPLRAGRKLPPPLGLPGVILSTCVPLLITCSDAYSIHNIILLIAT